VVVVWGVVWCGGGGGGVWWWLSVVECGGGRVRNDVTHH
jgi:hypothetical protein